MAPEAPGVAQQPVRQDPHLRRERVDPAPLVDAEEREPELRPGRVVDRAATGMHE